MERSQGKRLFILPVVSFGLHQKIIENTVVKRNQQLYSGKSLSNTNVRKRGKKNLKKERTGNSVSDILEESENVEVVKPPRGSSSLETFLSAWAWLSQGRELLPAPGFGPTLPRSCSELLL